MRGFSSTRDNYTLIPLIVKQYLMRAYGNF